MHLSFVCTHLKFVEITKKMKIIVRKPLMIKITKPHLRNFDASLSSIFPHSHMLSFNSSKINNSGVCRTRGPTRNFELRLLLDLPEDV